MLNKYIGDKKFYRTVLSVSVPLMVQMGITNFVSLLDNIMVGQLGTESMSGVSIVNQFIFIFNLLIFGAISAAGIFTAQYHGFGDEEGEKHTFRFKFLINAVAALIGIALFYFFNDELINMFLHEGTDGDLELTLLRGKEYLSIMLIGLLPYAISQVYASTMRETGESIVPMVASIVAVFTNFGLNIVLIFGAFGLPALGVRGAAIATVIARFAELSILLVWGHTHKAKCRYLIGAFKSFYIPPALTKQITIKGIPLMMNELFWALATTFRNQCYSTRGLDVVAAQNISSTIMNVFSVVYMAIGSSISIIIGNLLGAARRDEAVDTDRKMIVFSITCGACMGAIMIAFSSLFPMLYDTTDSVRTLAQFMIITSAITMPFSAFAHSAYFTLRTGGKVIVTLMFDSVYMWGIVMPVSIVLSYFTAIDIHLLFVICQGVEILKCVFGIILLKRRSWVNQLVG